MKRPQDYYVVTGKKLLPVVEETMKSYQSHTRALRKLKKKFGFEKILVSQFGLRETLRGVSFPEHVIPNPKVWRKLPKGEVVGTAYWPRGNTKEGKAMLAEFDKVRIWHADPLQEAVGYKWIFHSGKVFPFNCGIDDKKLIAYFTVPKLADGEETPENWYKPVPGVKKVKYEKLTELLGRKP